MIVFFAISYTQAKKGHVGMSLVVEVLPPRMQRVTNTFTLGLSVLTCAVLAYFGAKQAYFSYEINDVTMTPPYWPIWPSASIVPVGYGLLALRMSLQILQHIAPRRFPSGLMEDLEQRSTF
jgi:TRAP-type C4-dicarboxylate transport system permease small subunit